MRLTGGILAACALTLAACTTSGSAADVQATGSNADAALVCHHYMTQRAWYRGLATPALGDALKMVGYIAADAGQSQGTGRLHADLESMYNDARHIRSTYAASTRVYNDCKALGITS